MKCPRCGIDDDKVLESRLSKDGTLIRRRRECRKCGSRFTSYERIEEKPVIVIKKDGREQPFDRGKLERGVRTATEKLTIPDIKIQQLLDRVEDRVTEEAGSKGKITSSEIGEATLKELYNLSPVAYVRFAAVYRAFSTLSEFISEIDRIANGA